MDVAGADGAGVQETVALSGGPRAPGGDGGGEPGGVKGGVRCYC